MAEAEFALESPMATALRSAVQPKLAEYGWTTDAEDTTLFEYILAMLVNEKNEATIASELSNDLLDLGPDNLETQQFAHWLFEHISLLRNQLSGAGANDAEINMIESQQDASPANLSAPGNDQEMDGIAENSSSNIPPTGPKAMRNGSGSGVGANRAQRGRPMRDQLNQHMERSGDSALHRVRGTSGTGRINSHSREPPRGPRAAQVGRGIAAMANGRGGNMNGPMGMGHGAMNSGNVAMNMAGMPPMPMPPMGQNGMGGMLNPQQQIALMQMYEQQAQMMQQIFSGQAPTPFVNPNFQQNNRTGRGGKSLMDRMEKRHNGQPNKFAKKGNQDETMTDGGNTATENGDASAMDVEGSHMDPASTMCNFNTRCSKADCPFVHQSPAAPEGTPIDMSSTCSFGAACTNKKCAAKHPSPSQRQQFKSEQDCMFYPNCRDMNTCPFKHPSAAPCRNGADCTTPGCKFFHNPTMCKYTPCTNRFCLYKHAEGQKKVFKNKEWHAPKAGDENKDEHVSERKFVADEETEELIIPAKTDKVDTEIAA
ncbi:hypothetical protein EJ04DRAFT_466156 [Polyplosphaeria fusca]|uniref:Nab2-like CCCH zinc finger domain-containing protein n=1 Tax=Polyplosphaeria fusca TaxID=682080 RepID=A0A9P4QYE0_9PLEO|nr:hypothetical protein EJ04DRAFT_466156 [Polyplosphaeria fusca]